MPLGYSDIVGASFEVLHWPREKQFLACKIPLNGSVEALCWFDTEAEAEKHAIEEREREEAEHGQFGVGS